MFTGEISVVNGEVILPETFECDASGDVEISNFRVYNPNTNYKYSLRMVEIDDYWNDEYSKPTFYLY